MTKEELMHELAIIEYQEYYEKIGYKRIEPVISTIFDYRYIPDLVIESKEGKRIYFEFKLLKSKLNDAYFAYKKNILSEDPNAEFNFIILNNSYKPDLNVQAPFFKRAIKEEKYADIVRELSQDGNFTGTFDISYISVNNLEIDRKLLFEGKGIITYSVTFEEEGRKISDDGIEVGFNYSITMNSFLPMHPFFHDIKISIDQVK